jgi:sec-independent protein translocase protein TatB
MFDIGWGELVLIGIVALIVIGPKELPTALRTAGMWMGKVRRMASEFQGQFQEAMREAEMAELKKQVDEIGNSTASLANLDPLSSIKNDIESAFDDKPKPPPASVETSPTIAGEITPASSPAPPTSAVSETASINAPPSIPADLQVPPDDISPPPDLSPSIPVPQTIAPTEDVTPPKTAGERA